MKSVLILITSFSLNLYFVQFADAGLKLISKRCDKFNDQKFCDKSCIIDGYIYITIEKKSDSVIYKSHHNSLEIEEIGKFKNCKIFDE